MAGNLDAARSHAEKAIEFSRARSEEDAEDWERLLKDLAEFLEPPA